MKTSPVKNHGTKIQIELDGFHATPKELYLAAKAALNPKTQLRISISASAKARVKKSEAFVAKIARGKAYVYGVNTGFGKFAEVAIESSQLRQLQLNLIRSHAVGVGEPLPRDVVCLMWLLRLNTLLRGHSGIRWSTIEYIVKLLEAGILAEVPHQGSVGASGDLAPSAHASLALLGECNVTRPSGSTFETISAAQALRDLKLSPLELAPKEGLALINGTQLSTAYAIKAWWEGSRLIDHANLCLALAVEALRGSHLIVHPLLIDARNHPGTTDVAQSVAQWLKGKSRIRESHVDCDMVQDPYSIRCAPQVHGALKNDFDVAEQTLTRECNASSDNPLIFANESLSISGGNFHALSSARVSDQLASALVTLSAISERRISLAMSKESSRLPAFLTPRAGINSGLMMAHVTAAALVSESRSMAFPASVDSIPTSDDKEDHVSMGPIAGKKAIQILANTRRVLGIEMFSMIQAIHLLRPLTSTAAIEKVIARLHDVVTPIDHDRVFSADIESIAQLIDQGVLLP